MGGVTKKSRNGHRECDRGMLIKRTRSVRTVPRKAGPTGGEGRKKNNAILRTGGRGGENTQTAGGVQKAQKVVVISGTWD